MSSSDLSDLSSPLSTDDDLSLPSIPSNNLDHYFKNASGHPAQASPPAKKKRPPSPPHEYVLADNPDIAFICMFRSRFNAAFPKSLPHYGPQDLEQGVIDTIPSEQVERLLCALIGLVLNRKKDVERAHYQRPLEEAIQTHASQWPSKWQSKNPLHGGASFKTMSPVERLVLLTALILWSLSSSETIQAIIKDSYKQQRHDDDLNQPLSVQSWGRDGDKRRYWLIEGQDDTHFRLYRESNPALKHNTWRSMAGSIEELKQAANKIGEDGSQASRRLKDRIMSGIPRFEAGEEKRKRRDYRNARKAQFVRPEPAFSYEGRTRGKRIKYTFSDEDEIGSDALSTRRSNRQSGTSTPAEPARPTVTASGRQVRSRFNGAYGETMLGGNQENQQPTPIGDNDGDVNTDEQEPSHRRPQRTAQRDRDARRSRISRQITDDNSLGESEESDASTSGEEWNGGDDNATDDNAADYEDDGDEEMSESVAEDYGEVEAIVGNNHTIPRSLVVSLRYPKQETPSAKLDSSTSDTRPSLSQSVPLQNMKNHTSLAESEIQSSITSKPLNSYQDQTIIKSQENAGGQLSSDSIPVSHENPNDPAKTAEGMSLDGDPLKAGRDL